MSTLEDGTWEKPPRPRKKEEFVPIEEVSEEDLHPDWLSSTATPEEVLLAEEKETELLAMERAEEERREHEDAWGEIDLTTFNYDNFTREFMDISSKHGDLDALMDKYHLPKISKKDEIERMISKHPVTGKSYGPGGRESKGKHQKGQETIRKDGQIDNFRWRSNKNNK